MRSASLIRGGNIFSTVFLPHHLCLSRPLYLISISFPIFYRGSALNGLMHIAYWYRNRLWIILQQAEPEIQQRKDDDKSNSNDAGNSRNISNGTSSRKPWTFANFFMFYWFCSVPQLSECWQSNVVSPKVVIKKSCCIVYAMSYYLKKIIPPYTNLDFSMYCIASTYM
jgi:hypothetical protein